MSPASHTFRFSLLKLLVSQLLLPKAQHNCPVIVHSFTAHKVRSYRWKGGRMAAVGINCLKFKCRFDSELSIRECLSFNLNNVVIV